MNNYDILFYYKLAYMISSMHPSAHQFNIEYRPISRKRFENKIT